MQARPVSAILGLLLLLAPTAVQAQTSAAPPADLGCAAHIHAAEETYGIPGGLLMAIGVTESRLNPLAINRAGRTLVPDDREEAAALLFDASGTPYDNMSIGCMQIYARFHLDEVDGDPRGFLDPQTNVDYAARLLVYLFEHTGSWRDAVGRYHAGPNSPNYNRYICTIDRQVAALGGTIQLGCTS